MKKMILLLCAALTALLLCGCGGVFDKEYVSVSDYPPPPPAEKDGGERVVVRSMTELKKVLIAMVYDGSSGGSIMFDPNYEGNPPEDIESACWQVRTQDALCAYCVRNMSCSAGKIVNYYEASVEIDYTDYAAELSSIVQLPYSYGLQDILSTAMDENRTQVTVLVNASSYSVENIKSMVLDIYRKNPTVCVREPKLAVYMYSGLGRQRLYEINLDYAMEPDELIRCKAQLKNLDVAKNLEAEKLDDLHKAYEACRFLIGSCILSDKAPGSCYDALIRGETNSEGLALAYVEMCHQLDLDCRIVYGQLDGADHCWNIIRLDGGYYHVDVSRCYAGSFDLGFLRNDEAMWDDYRWNIAGYPACTGELSYMNTIGRELEELQPPETENALPAEAADPRDATEKEEIPA